MRQLDFIVFGVPRSGTSALTRALNLHPDIICGIERFGPYVNPRSIVYPESFRNLRQPTSVVSLERNLDLLAQKGDTVPFAGDKNPRYHYNLAAWNQLQPPVRKIAIYRSPWQFLESWRRRALSDDFPNWDRERLGPFALWELFAFLRNMLDQGSDTLLVPYDACFFDNPGIMRHVTAHIGADPERFDQDTFLQKLFAQSHRSRERPKLPVDEVELLMAADVDKIDRILLLEDAFTFDSVRDEIQGYLNSVSPRLAAATEDWINNNRSPKLESFITRWMAKLPIMAQVPNEASIPPTFHRCNTLSRKPNVRLANHLREMAGQGKTLSKLLLWYVLPRSAEAPLRKTRKSA
jgi:hypothetical protein